MERSTRFARLVGLALILCGAAACSGESVRSPSPAGEVIEEARVMKAEDIQRAAATALPAIDLETPTALETATFALG